MIGFSYLVWYSKGFRSDSVNYSKVEGLEVDPRKNELLISLNIDKTAKLKNLNNVEVKAQRPLVIYTKWRQLEFIQEAFETLNSMTDRVSWKSLRWVGEVGGFRRKVALRQGAGRAVARVSELFTRTDL